MSIWNDVSLILNQLELKLNDVGQSYLESSQELDLVFQELSSKFISLEDCRNKISQSGDIPSLIKLAGYSEKDRSEGEIVLIKKLNSLQQDLAKSQNQAKLSIYKSLKSIDGIKVFNI